MKKYKIFPIYIFYIAYFICSFLMSFSLLRGWFNPNISATSSFLSILLSSLGDLGVLSLIFTLVCLIFKSERKRINSLLICSFLFLLVILFLQGFSGMFSTFFSYTQLVSFKNPSQGELISGYANYFIRMFQFGNILLPTSLFILLVILSFFIKTDVQKERKFKKKLINLSISYLAMLLPVLVCTINVNDTANEISMNGLYGSSYMGVYNYYLYSIKDLWKKETKLDEEKKMQINAFLDKHQYVQDEEKIENKNLIVLQLEAINNFVINLEIDGELIAPNLTNLTTEGYYNTRFYSSAGMGNTSDCEFASLTGLYPNGNDLSIFEIEGENYPSLAKEFKELGYETFSIHGNEGGFYNRNVQHIELFGFDEHIDKNKLLKRNPNLNILKEWISDESLLDECIEIYKEKEKPFFSYNILVSSHSPFSVVDGVEEYKNKKLTSLANDYLSYVKYVDKAIGKFIEELKENDIYDNSIIMIYGDHTSSLLEKDVSSITNRNYDDVMYRLEMQNVPFILLGNEIEPYVDNLPYSHIDIFSTISNLFNLTPNYCFGVDMLGKETSYVYNPRSLDLIFEDYIILTNSSKVYYLNDEVEKINKEKINNLIKEFKEYKYLNDLLVASEYFK